MASSSQVAVESTPGRAQRPPGVVLTVLSASGFMAGLDVFIVNVALDDIGHDFPGALLADMSWILNAYAIVYAALLVPLGSLADRYGSKRGFLLGLTVFTLASAACAASPGLWALVVFRGLQAAGAAALTPASLGLLLAATAPERRARAVRIWSASAALAAAAGPGLGGLLVQSSWRWIFLVNVPVGAAALIAGARFLPDVRRAGTGRVPDVFGGLVLALSIASLSLALVKGPGWGWSSPATVGCLLWAAVGAGVFARRTAHHAAPLVAPVLLRVKAFAWSNATALLFSVAFGANLLAIVLWTQQVWHYSALRTGLAVAPGPLMVPLFAVLAQYATRRVQAGVIATVGSLLYGLAAVLLALRIGTAPHYAAELLPSMLISGAGVGLTMPTILACATADLSPAQGATGSAMVNMSHQIGNSLGVAALVATLTTATAGHTPSPSPHGWWLVSGAALLAALCALGMTPRGQTAGTVAQAPAQAASATTVTD
ncbi:MFS transporter [Streptomyces sp. NBC_01604]|uniref:MFS transporter n=1 Tax=Streptomyces sp. NBC_01604 TaxID=2975894 RepID=UPI00386EEAF8